MGQKMSQKMSKQEYAPARVAHEVYNPLVIRCGIPDKFNFFNFNICQVQRAVNPHNVLKNV